MNHLEIFLSKFLYNSCSFNDLRVILVCLEKARELKFSVSISSVNCLSSSDNISYSYSTFINSIYLFMFHLIYSTIRTK
ncbi:hypothetical protein EOM09_05805 [bacterium]|nr:hypothetical protein [bacterium]